MTQRDLMKALQEKGGDAVIELAREVNRLQRENTRLKASNADKSKRELKQTIRDLERGIEGLNLHIKHLGVLLLAGSNRIKQLERLVEGLREQNRQRWDEAVERFNLKGLRECQEYVERLRAHIEEQERTIYDLRNPADTNDD